jgi:hypothetical protein
MKLSQIQKKIKFISDAKGKPVEVVLPYEVYQEYMDMKISLEFYRSLETQDSIEKAKEDITAGRFKDYDDVEQLLKDLHG